MSKTNQERETNLMIKEGFKRLEKYTKDELVVKVLVLEKLLARERLLRVFFPDSKEKY